MPAQTPLPSDSRLRSLLSFAGFELSGFLREQHRKGVIVMSYIKTAEQTADIFTKNLPKPTFEKHAHTLLAGLPPEGLQHGKRTAPT